MFVLVKPNFHLNTVHSNLRFLLLHFWSDGSVGNFHPNTTHSNFQLFVTLLEWW